MLFDIYSKHIPNECPNCKTKWKYPSCSFYGHPMIAVSLSNVIDITCSNNNCRRNFVVDKEKIKEIVDETTVIKESEL